MISIYPLGDGELYAFAETPFIHRIDKVSLETTGRENLHDTIGIINQSSHPHSFNGEGTYNLGQLIGPMGPNYAIVHYPMTPSSVKDGRVVARVPCHAPTEPSYMHSFSVTANYFVLAEQSLHVRLKTVISSMLQAKPLVHSLKWRQTMTRFRLIDRKTGKEFPAIEYVTDAFFFLHTVNAFETADGRHLVVDICCYNDARMLDCMYIDALQCAQSEPNYASLFRGRPKRFVLPLKPERGYSGDLNESCNLSASEAYWLHPGGSNDDNVIVIRPDELCHLGCETPTVNYAAYNGRPYRYFYAISSDVDADNPGTLIKVDTAEKTCRTWAEKYVYASEPIFIPRPNANAEDDGVIISSLIWGGEGNDKRVGCLVLDASTWTELGRTEFVTVDQVPKCLHGCYVPSSN